MTDLNEPHVHVSSTSHRSSISPSVWALPLLFPVPPDHSDPSILPSLAGERGGERGGEGRRREGRRGEERGESTAEERVRGVGLAQEVERVDFGFNPRLLLAERRGVPEQDTSP